MHGETVKYNINVALLLTGSLNMSTSLLTKFAGFKMSSWRTKFWV